MLENVRCIISCGTKRGLHVETDIWRMILWGFTWSTETLWWCKNHKILGSEWGPAGATLASDLCRTGWGTTSGIRTSLWWMYLLESQLSKWSSSPQASPLAFSPGLLVFRIVITKKKQRSKQQKGDFRWISRYFPKCTNLFFPKFRCVFSQNMTPTNPFRCADESLRSQKPYASVETTWAKNEFIDGWPYQWTEKLALWSQRLVLKNVIIDQCIILI